MSTETSKPFFLVNKQGQPSGELQLAYGAGVDDIPFFLYVTSTYVASKIDRHEVKYSDIVSYVESYADELRQIALDCRNQGMVNFTLK